AHAPPHVLRDGVAILNIEDRAVGRARADAGASAVWVAPAPLYLPLDDAARHVARQHPQPLVGLARPAIPLRHAEQVAANRGSNRSVCKTDIRSIGLRPPAHAER